LAKNHRLPALLFKSQNGATKSISILTKKEVIICQHHQHHTTTKRDLIPIIGKLRVQKTTIRRKVGKRQIPGRRKNSATNAKASKLKRTNKSILVVPSSIQPKSEKELKMGKNQHVVPHNGKWAVRGANNQRATSTHSTQSDAIDAARDIAQNQQSEVVIHRPDGRIRDKDSYGNDPCPPRDTKH
jgi:hypothetical protein